MGMHEVAVGNRRGSCWHVVVVIVRVEIQHKVASETRQRQGVRILCKMWGMNMNIRTGMISDQVVASHVNELFL